MHSVFFLQFTGSRCQHSITILYEVPSPGAWVGCGGAWRDASPGPTALNILNHFKKTFTWDLLSSRNIHCVVNHLIPYCILGLAPSFEEHRLDLWLRCCAISTPARLGCGRSSLIYLYYNEAGKKPEETVLVYSNFTVLPLQLQLEMVRSRDVRCLSFPLTVTTLLTSTSWLLYGLQVSDLYIVVRLAYSCPTFNTARNIELSWWTEMLSLFVSGPKLPRNHHQPHQILSLLEVWIFSFRFTFLQAHAHMRWGWGGEKGTRWALKGKNLPCFLVLSHMFGPQPMRDFCEVCTAERQNQIFLVFAVSPFQSAS